MGSWARRRRIPAWWTWPRRRPPPRHRGGAATRSSCSRSSSPPTGELRSDDRLFRLGGDEFVVIPGGATPEAAERVAHRLLTVSSEPFQLSGGQRITVTASVGVAQVDASGERDAVALMRDA